MQAANWYQYEESYRKYGFDMKPEQLNKPKAKPAAGSGIAAKDKKRLLALTVILGVMCIAIIISAAFAATLQYRINRITLENTEISREIEDINIKLQTANSVTALEKKASGKLGMKYPSASQIVYVSDITAPKDFAATVKEEAYN
jgi:cell division protein FtsL